MQHKFIMIETIYDTAEQLEGVRVHRVLLFKSFNEARKYALSYMDTAWNSVDYSTDIHIRNHSSFVANQYEGSSEDEVRTIEIMPIEYPTGIMEDSDPFVIL